MYKEEEDEDYFLLPWLGFYMGSFLSSWFGDAVTSLLDGYSGALSAVMYGHVIYSIENKGNLHNYRTAEVASNSGIIATERRASGIQLGG